MKNDMPTRLADIVLSDSEGGEFQLGALWRSQPALIVFLRHFG